MRAIERRHGRPPAEQSQRNARADARPRFATIRSTPFAATQLTLPHPRMHERAFVLRPLARHRARGDRFPAVAPRAAGCAECADSALHAHAAITCAVATSAWISRNAATSSSKARSARARPASPARSRISSAPTPCSRRRTRIRSSRGSTRTCARFALPTQLNFLFQRVDQLRGLAQLDMFRRAHRRRFPARQGPAVRAPQPHRRRVRALRQGLFAPEAADADARPGHLSAGAGDDADRARAQARRRLRAQRSPSTTWRGSPTRTAGYFYQYDDAPLLIVNSERLNFVDDPEPSAACCSAASARMRGQREFFNLGAN